MRITLCVLVACSMCFFPHVTDADVHPAPPPGDSDVVRENTPVIIPIGNREPPHHTYLSFGLREKAPYLGLVALIGIGVMILALRREARMHEHI
jgi:hypothetical protein